jgi:hypothetical protein
MSGIHPLPRRPLHAARQCGACRHCQVAVAKLDRLSRNVAFIFRLSCVRRYRSGVVRRNSSKRKRGKAAVGFLSGVCPARLWSLVDR